MIFTIEVPDQKQEFITELLQSLPFVKFTAKASKVRKQDTTDYLLSTKANRERLLDSIERLERGEGEHHDLIEA